MLGVMRVRSYIRCLVLTELGVISDAGSVRKARPLTNPLTKALTNPLTNPLTKPVTNSLTNPLTKPLTKFVSNDKRFKC